jgi:hypothetical protein
MLGAVRTDREPGCPGTREDTLACCDGFLAGRPVLVKSLDQRLRAQSAGVTFA